MPRLSKTLLVLLFAAVCWETGELAAERPHIYAITNVRIVTAPGQVIEQGTIVLREGLIEAIGADLQAPPDAQVIEGQEGWTVYPAFIDAATHLGVKEEQRGGGGGPPNPAAAIARLAQGQQQRTGVPHELSAIHPEKAVIDELAWDRDAAERHRKLGFAIAQSLPRSGVFKGYSAVLALGDDEVQRQILAPRLAQVVALESGGFLSREYPSVKIGAIAAFRQALLDAQRQALWEKRFEEDPSGMPRPEYRSSDRALEDLVERRTPALFVALSSLDHDRFGQLSEEFGLQGMVLARGCREPALRLKASGLPVLLPLVFPKKPKVDDPGELEATPIDRLREYVSAPRLPAELAAEGVRFALTGNPTGSNSDFFKNLAQAVEAGLGPERALAALTLEPARLLGLEEVTGTLEAGKIGNLLVVDGDLFVEKPELRWVFVDGRGYEMEQKESPGDPNAEVDPRGVWEITSQVMGRSNRSTWTIQGSPGAYSGFAESERGGRRDFESVTLEGNAMTVRLPSPAGSLEITVIISGDTLTGETSIETPRGSMSFSVEGKRISGPEGGAR